MYHEDPVIMLLEGRIVEPGIGYDLAEWGIRVNVEDFSEWRRAYSSKRGLRYWKTRCLGRPISNIFSKRVESGRLDVSIIINKDIHS